MESQNHKDDKFIIGVNQPCVSHRSDKEQRNVFHSNEIKGSKAKRGGTINRNQYKLFIKYLSSGKPPSPKELTEDAGLPLTRFTFKQAKEKFRSCIRRMKINIDKRGKQRLVYKKSGLRIIPEERFVSAIRRIDTKKPYGHHSTSHTLKKIKKTYSMDKCRFGFSSNFVRKVISTCNDVTCPCSRTKVSDSGDIVRDVATPENYGSVSSIPSLLLSQTNALKQASRGTENAPISTKMSVSRDSDQSSVSATGTKSGTNQNLRIVDSRSCEPLVELLPDRSNVPRTPAANTTIDGVKGRTITQGPLQLLVHNGQYYLIADSRQNASSISNNKVAVQVAGGPSVSNAREDDLRLHAEALPSPEIWYNYQDVSQESNGYLQLVKIIQDMHTDLIIACANGPAAQERLHKKLCLALMSVKKCKRVIERRRRNRSSTLIA